MKYYLTILISFILFAACQQGGVDKWPDDLKGKKKLIKEKRAELKELQADISLLKDEIIELDTTLQQVSRRAVKIDTIGSGDVSRFVEIQSVVEADDAVAASSDIGGRITNLSVSEGQYVQKGQLIATIDVESVNKQLSELETALTLAEDVFQRQSKLWEQNIGSEIQFLQAKNNKEQIEKRMETARFQLTKSNVYAPNNGVIDMIMKEAGEVAGPGQSIVKILNTYKVKVVADVPERYLPVVKKGQKVDIHFPALNEDRTLRISSVGRTINPANRTFEAEVILLNKQGTFKPNLRAIMKLKDFEAKDAVSIPLVLVQQEISGKDYVYIKAEGADGPFAKKAYVMLGERSEGNVIITEGLNSGDQIIVEGGRGLAENELIELL